MLSITIAGCEANSVSLSDVQTVTNPTEYIINDEALAFSFSFEFQMEGCTIVYTLSQQDYDGGDYDTNAITLDSSTGDFTVYVGIEDLFSYLQDSEVLTITATSQESGESDSYSFVLNYEYPCLNEDILTVATMTQSSYTRELYAEFEIPFNPCTSTLDCDVITYELWERDADTGIEF